MSDDRESFQVDLKSNLVGIPRRRLSVRKQSTSNNDGGDAAPASPPSTVPTDVAPASSSAGDSKRDSLADDPPHSPPKRSPSVRFAETSPQHQQQVQQQQQQKQQEVTPAASPVSATPQKSALRKNPADAVTPSPPSAQASPSPRQNKAAAAVATKKVVATPPPSSDGDAPVVIENNKHAAASSTSVSSAAASVSANSASSHFDDQIINEFGDLFIFEQLISSSSSSSSTLSSSWCWGVCREVTSQRKHGTTAQLLKQQLPSKRAMRAELWEVEAREDILDDATRSKLGAARRGAAAANQELQNLEAARRALSDSLRGAELSIESLESALAVDFADVHGMLQRSRDSLLELRAEHFAELRSYAKPPVVVRQVLECVLIALGTTGDGTPSWEAVKAAVRDQEFVRTIRDFEPSQLTSGAVQILSKRLEGSSASLTLDRAKQASFACGPLFLWLEAQLACAQEAKRSKAFYDLSKQIAQHKHRARELSDELLRTEPRMKKAQQSLEGCESDVDRLLFGGHVEFARGGGGGGGAGGASSAFSRTGGLLSSPFSGLKFVPSRNKKHGGPILVDLLRSATHPIGPPDVSEEDDGQQQQQQSSGISSASSTAVMVLTEQKATLIRSVFDLPKAKPLVGAANSKNNNAAAGTPGRRGAGAAAAGNNRTTSKGPAARKAAAAGAAVVAVSETPRGKTHNKPSPSPRAAGGVAAGGASPSSVAASLPPIASPRTSSLPPVDPVAVASPQQQQQQQQQTPRREGQTTPRSNRLQNLKSTPASSGSESNVMSHLLASPGASPGQQPLSSARSNPRVALTPMKK